MVHLLNNKKTPGEFGFARGLLARVDDALDRKQAQAELAIIIAAAMLIRMLCIIVIMV
jgi:hypothetical protein